jgi:hypothetical protein
MLAIPRIGVKVVAVEHLEEAPEESYRTRRRK